MIELLVIGVLTVVIILLLVDRYFTSEQHQKKEDKLLDELSRAVKAVISRNANDYVMTASIDKVAPEEKPPVNPEFIAEEAISDDEFFEGIGKGLKATEK